MALQDWSHTDISLAKEHFLSGLAIKDIAKKIGRTPSSTNKALTRFGIRLPKKPKETIKTISKSKFKAPGFDRKSLRKLLDNWVSFWDVCDYLSAQKIGVFEQSDYGTQLEQRKFLIGCKTYSSSQVLLMANKIRTENNLPTLFVDGLSW